MTRTDSFFDTNILVYLIEVDATKARRSADVIVDGGIVSVQVLNEFVLVARRKMRRPWSDVREMITWLREHCDVVPLTIAVHERGLEYAERYQLGIFDSMILAAAVLAGCTTLYSEDMHDGLVIDGLTIKNPYAA